MILIFLGGGTGGKDISGEISCEDDDDCDSSNKHSVPIGTSCDLENDDDASKFDESDVLGMKNFELLIRCAGE